MIGRHRAEFEAIAAGVVDGENHDWFVVAVMKMDCSRLQRRPRERVCHEARWIFEISHERKKIVRNWMG